MQLPRAIKTLASLSLLMLGAVSQAETPLPIISENHEDSCGSLSPQLVSQKDAYYDIIDAGELVNPDVLSDHTVFEALRTLEFKSGTGQRVRCMETGNEWRAEVSQLELSDIHQKLQRSNPKSGYHDIVLTAYEYNEDTRVSRNGSLVVSADAAYLASIGSSSFTTVRRFRQGSRHAMSSSSSSAGSSSMRESVSYAELANNGVVLHQVLYVNGRLAELVNWTLSTRR